MALIASAQAFSGALTDLQTLFGTLKKYESTFSAEAKQLFQSTSVAADQALKELGDLPESDDNSIAGYLATGNRTMSLRTVLQQVQQAVSNFTSGAIPVPRSSKEELSRVHGLILSVKFALSSEQQLLITQLRKLCVEVETQKQDFDIIETNLDNTMRNVLQQVHGKATLDPEVLQSEMERLQSVMLAARAAGAKQLEDILALAMNSLQRLHACDAESDDDEEDAVSGGAVAMGDDDFDDDDDDPFFMPMPGAIKWAEASKFKELAKPLAPEQPADKQFMIVMEDGPEEDLDAQSPPGFAAAYEVPSASTTAESSPNAMQQLSLEDTAQPSGAAAVASTAAAAEPAESTAAEEAADLAAAAAAEEADFAADLAVEEARTDEATAGDVATDEAVADGEAAGEKAADEVAGVVPVKVSAGEPAEEDVAGTPAATAGVPEEAAALAAAEETSAAGASAAKAAAETSVVSPRPPVPEAVPLPPPVAAPAKEAPAKEAETSTSVAKPGAPTPAAAGPADAPVPEKLTDFVNFLNGENPGACMFHAQMRLSPEGCMKLANFLRSSARVRALSLSHNYLGDAGLRLICEGLRENKSVTALDLPDNNITDIGAAILADAIKDNPSLTQLQLAYNKIGDQGAIALAQVIRTSHSLKKLGLAFNNIGKVGCQALTSAISSNQSLKHMQLLPGNPVEEKDAKALAKALKRNNKFSIKQLLGLKGDA